MGFNSEFKGLIWISVEPSAE